MEHITEHNLRMALTLNNISIDRYPLDIYTYYSMTNSIPLDYISDHPPLAGKLLYLGQEINFISWNIMQGIGGVSMHGAIPPAMEANRTRLIYEYLNNLLRIPDLDVIFLQEADHRILGNILGTWGVIYNTENKPGIVILLAKSAALVTLKETSLSFTVLPPSCLKPNLPPGICSKSARILYIPFLKNLV